MRTLYALAGLRILLGVLWLANLSWKLPPDFGKNDAEGLLYNFRLAEEHAVIGPLQDLTREVVIPHFTLFGWLVFLAELAAGVLLLLGLWTRVGALIGARAVDRDHAARRQGARTSGCGRTSCSSPSASSSSSRPREAGCRSTRRRRR